MTKEKAVEVRDGREGGGGWGGKEIGTGEDKREGMRGEKKWGKGERRGNATKSELDSLATWEANNQRDEVLRQGMVTLFWKLADWEDSGIVP